MVRREFWRDRPVLVTGHTGFKGGWLATWLLALGARVTGYALAPDTTPSYFAGCGRAAGRARSLQRQQGGGRAGDGRLPALVLRLRRPHRHRARRQRHRRRRLGRGPARPRRHARAGRRTDGARAKSLGGEAVAARAGAAGWLSDAGRAAHPE